MLHLKIDVAAVRKETALREMVTADQRVGFCERTSELLKGDVLIEKLLYEEEIDKVEECCVRSVVASPMNDRFLADSTIAGVASCVVVVLIALQPAANAFRPQPNQTARFRSGIRRHIPWVHRSEARFHKHQLTVTPAANN